MLRHVGLFEERYRPMETYSTGMKQRVKLAQALVHDPVIAFLDEPTAGLDPLGRREMLELIRRVGGEFGISIVISTHLMGDVERACDSVVVLDAGRLLRSGPVSGFTEETETLEVELLEGAEAVVAALRGRGLEPTVGTAGRRLTLEGVSGEDYDTLRDVIVDAGALLYRLAPARHSLADVFTSDADPARRGGRVVSSRPAEVFDLGYRGYEGERTGRWARRDAIWRDGIRISLGLGRGVGAKVAPWLLLALALVPMVVLVVVAAFVGPATNPDDFELPSYGGLLRVRDGAARPLRGGRRAAPDLPRSKRPRALAVRRAADHAARLRRRAVGRLRDGRARGGVGAGGRALHVERPRRRAAPARSSGTTGTSCRGSSPPAPSSPWC